MERTVLARVSFIGLRRPKAIHNLREKGEGMTPIHCASDEVKFDVMVDTYVASRGR